jgi:hypothetical protein
MAWAFVRSSISPDGTTATATTVALTVTAVGNNNLIVGIVENGLNTPATCTGVSDDKGNTYTLIDAKSNSTDGAAAVVFYKEGITNAPTVITATFSAAVWFRRMAVSEYSGIATSSAIDGHTGALRQPPGAAGANNILSGSITTTVGGDLIWGGCFDNPGTPLAYTTGTSPIAFTQRLNSSGGSIVEATVIEDTLQAAAGTVQATFGQGVVANCMAWVAAFKDAAGGAVAAPSPTPILPRTMAFQRQMPWLRQMQIVADRPVLPVIVGGLSTGVAPAGPYKAASGNFYTIGQAIGDTSALTAIKTSDPLTTWTNVGTDKIVNGGFPIYDISCYRVGDVLHMSVITGIANVHYVKFDMSTETYSTPEAVDTGFDPSTSTSTNPLSSNLVVRSNGEVVVIYNGSRVSSHSRIVAKRRNTGGSWVAADGVTNPTPIDAGSSTVDYIDGYALLGASDRVHFHWRDATTSAIMHRSLDSSNTLTAATGPHGNLNQYGLNPRGVSYNNAGTQKVYVAGWDGARGLTGIYYDSGASPTISATTATVTGLVDSPTRAFVDGTDIYVTYNRVTDFDIYIAKSTDNGATFSGHTLVHRGVPDVTEEQRFSPGQSVCGEVYTRSGQVVVPFMVRDYNNSQWVYNEYYLRPGAVIQAYTMPAVTGTFAVAGNAADTDYEHNLVAVTGTFTVAGTATGLKFGHKFAATVGTFVVASVGARIVATRTMLAAPGAFTVNGVAAGLRHGFVPLTAVTGTFTVAGQATGLAFGHMLKAVVGTFAVAGQATALRATRILPAVTGAFTVTGVPAALTYRHNFPIACVVGAFNVTGIATGVLATRKMPVTVGTFTTTGIAAGLKFGHSLTAAPGAFTVSGVAAGLKFGHVLKAVVGTFTVAGTATGFLFNHVTKAVVGTFAVNGVAAGTLAARRVTAVTGAFTVNGQAATLKLTHVMPSATGAFVVNGVAVNLAYSAAGHYTLPVTVGTFSVTGNANLFKWTHVLKAVVGPFSVTGLAAGMAAARITHATVGGFTVAGVAARLAYGPRVVASVGTFTVNGVAVALRSTRNMAAATGAFTVNGVAANLVYSAAGQYTLPTTVGTFLVAGVAVGTWDPAALGSGITLSNGNLTAECTGTVGNNITKATPFQSSGKYYYEFTIVNTLDNSVVGVANAAAALTEYLGQDNTHSAGIFNGVWLGGGGTTTAPAFVTGHVYGIAVDVTNKLAWAKDITAGGNWNANAGSDPATGSLGSTLAITGGLYPACSLINANDKITINFGASAYAGALPSGYSNWAVGAAATLSRTRRALAASAAFSVVGSTTALRYSHNTTAAPGAFVVNGIDAALVRGGVAVSGVKVWTGSAWTVKPVKVWTGAAWVPKPVKTWNGSVWR